jgi:hypothetical protein
LLSLPLFGLPAFITDENLSEVLSYDSDNEIGDKQESDCKSDTSDTE